MLITGIQDGDILLIQHDYLLVRKQISNIFLHILQHFTDRIPSINVIVC